MKMKNKKGCEINETKKKRSQTPSKKRVKNSTILRKPSVVVNNSKKKKLTRLNYSNSNVSNALKALDNGISLRKAAAAYGVPVATLARRRKNLDSIKKKTGPGTVLSNSEEEEIVNWILYRAERGSPVTKTELLDSVQKYVQSLKKKTPFVDSRPSRHWFEGFKKRHQQLSIRKPQHLSLSRATVSREDLKEWFNEQEKYLKNKNLLDIAPSRVFNCDETNIVLCPESERVFSEKGSRSVYKVVDAGKESLTVLFMYSANGARAPPMLMYAYKENIPKSIVENTPKGWGIGISENGWMTSETFFEYITNVFYPWLFTEKVQFPVIIYLDNHSSHINIPLVSFCREKQIELIGLYPNSTHVTQPLDISFFHPFKETWKKAVPKWKNEHNCRRLKKEDFPLVLKFALDNMKEEKNVVISGFRGSGLYPFNSNAVDYDVLKKKKRGKETVNPQQNENATEEKRRHLQTFESNLPGEVIKQFKDAASNGSWTGDVEQKGLFDYWLKINDMSTGDILKPKPIIRKIENLDNYRVNLIEGTQEESSENNQCLVMNNDNTLLLKNDSIACSNIDILEECCNLINETVINEEIVVRNFHAPENSPSEDISVESTTKEEKIFLNNILDSALPCDTVSGSILLSCFTNSESLYLENDGIIHNQNISADNGQTESVEEIKISELKQNNNSKITNEGINASLEENFKKAFTFPVKYLPKKKRVKVENSTKEKLPSAGTSDEWWQHHMEKEKQQQVKEEKKEKKRKLQEEKKKLIDEKKQLEQRVKAIQARIKEEAK